MESDETKGGGADTILAGLIASLPRCARGRRDGAEGPPCGEPATRGRGDFEPGAVEWCDAHAPPGTRHNDRAEWVRKARERWARR